MSTLWQNLRKWSPWSLLSGIYTRMTTEVTKSERTCTDSPSGDLVILQLADLQIQVCRQKPVDVPHEITVVVPRVEIHRRYTRPDGCDGEEELIYNSVTVVHAPRHTPSGELPLIPEVTSDEGQCQSIKKTWRKT